MGTVGNLADVSGVVDIGTTGEMDVGGEYVATAGGFIERGGGMVGS